MINNADTKKVGMNRKLKLDWPIYITISSVPKEQKLYTIIGRNLHLSNQEPLNNVRGDLFRVLIIVLAIPHILREIYSGNPDNQVKREVYANDTQAGNKK